MKNSFFKKMALGAILSLTCIGSAKGSSPSAWADLEKTVRADCYKQFKANAGKEASTPKIIVDPMAGENIIAGLIRYEWKKTPVTMLCLYSKSEKKVLELFEIKDPSVLANWTPLKAG